MQKYDPTGNLPAESREALARVLDPVDPSSFFNDTFEEDHHLISRGETDRFTDLISIDVIDDFIAGKILFAGDIDVTRAEPRISREAFTLDNDRIDRSALLRLYQDKATIIAPQLHAHHKPLGDFVRALEPVFSASVQTNCYLTPPGSKGFRTHYDNHDVFILQVSGKKQWRIYDEPVGKPFRGEGFEPGVHDVGKPEEEFVLEAGDTVYIPRGMMHDAESFEDEASLHITLGLVTKTWADVLLEAVSKAALEMEGLRRALPPGYANQDFNREPARAQFAEFVAEVAKKAELDEPLDIIAEDYLRSRTPEMSGIVNYASQRIDDDQRFVVSENPLHRLIEDPDGDQFAVVTRGGSSEFVLSKRKAFDRAMGGDPFTRADLPEIEEADATDMIRRLLSRGLIRLA